MPDFLTRMAASSHRRAAAAAASRTSIERAALAAPPPPALVVGEFGVIAEVKRRSPAEGALDTPLPPAERALAYEAAGACAVSVLTEPDRFDGSLGDLEAVAAGLEAVPALRKDFIVAPVQVFEARAAGAGGILLIAAMLDDDSLAALTRLARDLGLFVLLEAFDRDDLARIAAVLALPPLAASVDAGQLLAGVNSRDLRTLRVDRGRLAALAGALPAGVPAVAESGIVVAADAARAATLGYRAALVGTALMRAADPAALVADLMTAGARAARVA
ncbi:MAG: indole-3-glycerol-phosphate synthase [Pseudomonadota bacterium]